MPFSHGKDGGVCVFPVLPQGRDLPLPPGFGIFRSTLGFRPAEVNRRAGQETHPHKAISVMRDMATAAALKPRLSLWNQTGSRKRRRGGPPARPYGVSGKRKQNRGGAGKQKRTKPQNIPELRPFYPYCARLRSFISCSYSRREASASLDMGRMTKMLKMVIRPMPTSPRSHTKV